MPTSTRSTAAWRGCAASSTTRAAARTYLAVIAEYAASHPDEPWIRGGGWYMDDFPGGTPRREDLDAIVPDRPVFLTNRDGHGAWVNTRALELGWRRRPTPADPADGRIERDADGNPSGTLHEGAMDLVERLEPDDTPADLEAALRLGQAYLHSLGHHGLAGRDRPARGRGARLRRPGVARRA